MRSSRSLIPALLGILLLAGCGAAEAESAAIPPWRHDIPQALSEAIAAKKPMLFRFTAEWCPPCKRMDKEVWPEAAVRNALGPVVAIRMDADDPASEALYRKLGIEGYPTLVLFDASGKEVGRRERYQTADEVIAFLATIR